jgi:hypothetical protein
MHRRQVTKLTQEQFDRVINALDNIIGKCPLCGLDDWGFSGIVNIPVHCGNGVFLSDSTVPALLVICQNCQYMAQFAAKPFGVLDE